MLAPWTDAIHLPALSGIVLIYLLVFARIGAMVMLLPAIGEMGVPARVRLVLALAISFALAPAGRSASIPPSAPQTTVGAGAPDRPGSHRRHPGRRAWRASS